MKRELLLSLFLLSMCIACGDDDPAAPVEPGPTGPVAPRNGLVAEYKFGGNANDTGGSANNATVFGATLTIDRFGNANSAYLLDDTDVIQAPNGDLVTGNAVSVSIWFKVNAQPVVTTVFLVCNEFGVYADATNFGLYITTPSSGSASGAVVDLTRWHHLLGTYDGASIVVYLDGELVGSTGHSGTLTPIDDELQLNGYDDRYLTGIVDDLRVYDRAITNADEIYALYHEGGFDL